MNVRLDVNFKFTAGYVYLGKLDLNNYTGTVNFTTNTKDPYEQSIAVERVNFFINNIIHGAIFICDSDKETIDNYRKAGARVIEIPEDPYDQIINMALLSKLSAITEERIIIEQMQLQSEDGNGVRFFVTFEEGIGPFAYDGWWSESSVATCNPDSTNSIIDRSANKPPAWETFYLGWEEHKEPTNKNPPATTGNVVVGKFNDKK